MPLPSAQQRRAVWLAVLGHIAALLALLQVAPVENPVTARAPIVRAELVALLPSRGAPTAAPPESLPPAADATAEPPEATSPPLSEPSDAAPEPSPAEAMPAPPPALRADEGGPTESPEPLIEAPAEHSPEPTVSAPPAPVLERSVDESVRRRWPRGRVASRPTTQRRPSSGATAVDATAPC